MTLSQHTRESIRSIVPGTVLACRNLVFPRRFSGLGRVPRILLTTLDGALHDAADYTTAMPLSPTNDLRPDGHHMAFLAAILDRPDVSVTT